MNDWKQACEEMLLQCLNWQKGESFCLLYDQPMGELAAAIASQAARLDVGEVVQVQLTPRSRDGEEPPSPAAAALKASEVAVMLTSCSLSHTAARRAASEKGCRIASIPKANQEMLVRGLAVDHKAMAERCRRVRDQLAPGGVLHITSDKGTDLSMDISGQPLFMDAGQLGGAGAFGNLPAGETALTPRDGSTEGVLVVDGSMSGVGLLEEPLRIHIENGEAVSIEGGPQAQVLRDLLEAAGPRSGNIAELGIGTNDKAEISGMVLEDEKVMGTIHIALGNDCSMGGTVDVPIHLDGIVQCPSVQLASGEFLLRDGRLLV